MKIVALMFGLLLIVVAGCSGKFHKEEITFRSGSFEVVGDLQLPEGNGPFPLVIFVHGDGPNNRNSYGSYSPIMERMLRAGYATFAWDKPGTGASTGEIDRSRLQHQRAQIVLDAIRMLRQRRNLDPDRIGMWGISQAGYVMPRVLTQTDDIAFMIAVSCPGVPGVDQGSYLLTAQAICAGMPEKYREEVEDHFAAVERARSYEDYVSHKKALADYPGIESLTELGLSLEARPREEWEAEDLAGDYYWNPMQVVDTITIPVLAFFGERDTQIDPVQGAEAYDDALSLGGNPHSRVELIPETDHNIIISETGCMTERDRRSSRDWKNYPVEYLDTIEQWLMDLDLP